MEPVEKTTTEVKSGLGGLLLNCRDAARLQSEAMDARLSVTKRLGLALHLLICKWCRRYGKQVRFLRDAAHDHPEDLTNAVPQTLSPEARERIRQRLKSGEQDG